MYLSTPSNGKAYIRAWAYNSSFYGYFIVTGPSLYTGSGTATWPAGGTNYNTGNFNAVVGKYCVQGIDYSTEKVIGSPCESIT
jgi:hypothetical protein